MEQMPDAARPYTNSFYRELAKLPYDNVDNLAPAGAIVSCVKDIIKMVVDAA